jgi:hypothetical protein
MKIMRLNSAKKNAYTGILNSMGEKEYPVCNLNDACTCTGNSNCF